MGSFANGYAYRRTLTTDHTKVVGGSNLSNFIMYFKVVNNDLKSVANGGKVVNGTHRDFRLEISGSKIQHEVTRYDAATGSLEGWCLIPTLLGASGTVIYLYYGATLGATEEDPSAVWSPSGWADVVHMADGGYSSVSESNRFTAGNISGATNTNDSPVGSGYTFDGVNDYIDLGNYGRWTTRPISISFWAKPTKTSTYGVPFATANMNSPYEGYHARFDHVNAGDKMTTQTGNNTGGGPGNRNSATGSVTNTLGQWDHWHIQFHAHNDVRFYKNGVLDTSETYSGTATTIAYAAFSSTSRSSFGRNFVSDQYFGGAMAEFKIRNAALPFSTNYMQTEYANQSDYSTFFTVGSEESPPPVIPDDTSHGHTADSVALTQEHFLSPADAAQAHSADAVVISQKHLLVVQDTLHGHTADSVSIVEHKELEVDDALHAHYADEATVSGNLLFADEAFHDHVVDNIDLIQKHVLGVDSTQHGHTADAAAVTQKHQLIPADTLHGQTVEPITLTQRHLLAVLDALHTQTAENTILTQRQLLAVQNALHAHYVDQPYVFTNIPLIVQDASHNHIADGVIIYIKVKATPVMAIMVNNRPHSGAQITKPNAGVLLSTPQTRLHQTKPDAELRGVAPLNVKVKP